eukprot:scaffold126405_cov19-Tisochrysis_lutea.AAC.1
MEQPGFAVPVSPVAHLLGNGACRRCCSDKQITLAVEQAGFAADNVTYGMGGGRFAFRPHSWVSVAMCAVQGAHVFPLVPCTKLCKLRFLAMDVSCTSMAWPHEHGHRHVILDVSWANTWPHEHGHRHWPMLLQPVNAQMVLMLAVYSGCGAAINQTSAL